MLMGIRKMGFALLSPFIEDRISVRRVRLLRLVLMGRYWVTLFALFKGCVALVRASRDITGRHGVPYKLYKGTGSVCTAPALYNVGHEGTVSAAEYRHLRTPPSSAPPATEPETSKRRWWKNKLSVKFLQILWRNRDFCPMSNEFSEQTSHLAMSFKTLDWISFFAQWCIKVSYLFRICSSSSPVWVEFLEQDKPSFLEVALSIWNKK